jgi:glycerophosphoryl diester phosphodiesterase
VLLVAHRTPATRAACEQLASAGARVFEADVQVDDRERIVVSHYLPFGGVLQRDNWRVRWHTAAARDPRLPDVTALVPEGCLVLLDLKEKAPERRARLVAALIDALPDRTRFRACGGHPDDLETMRSAGFRTWRTARDSRELAGVLADGALPDEAVSVRHSLLTGDVLERLRDCTSTVVAWTVNDLHRARTLRGLGVDGVTTDRVAVLRALSAIPN